MRAIKKVLLAMTVAAIALCAICVPALADTDYTYTVRVFAGNNGTIDGQKVYVVGSDFAYGDTVTLDTGWVKLNEGSKYYVKGFRLSGQDDLHSASFEVTEDMDFVVAYGVQSDMVSYTIRFVEYGTGKELANDDGNTSVTFWGRVGDKPVVPYQYIKGYRPQYRNITGTLGAEGTNVWTLEYKKIEQGSTTTNAAAATGTTSVAAVTTAGAAAATTTDFAAGTNAGAVTAEGTPTRAELTDSAAPKATLATPSTEEILDVDTLPAEPDAQSGDMTRGNDAGIANVGVDNTHSKDAASALVGNSLLTALSMVALGVITYLFLGRKSMDDEDME